MNGVARRAMLCLALISALGACTRTDGPAPAADPSSSAPSSVPPPSVPVNDRYALRTQEELLAAVATMPQDLDFEVRHTYEQAGRLIDTSGSFRAPDRSTSRTEVLDPSTGDTYVLRTRSIGSSQWMQMDDWTGRDGCWLSLAPTDVPVGLTFLTAGRPAPVQLPGRLSRTPRGYALPYRWALLLVTGQLIEAAALLDVDDPRAPVRVFLGFEQDSLASLTLDGKDLVAVLPRDHPGDPAALRLAETLSVNVDFDAASAPQAQAPPVDTVFTEAEETCRPPVA